MGYFCASPWYVWAIYLGLLGRHQPVLHYNHGVSDGLSCFFVQSLFHSKKSSTSVFLSEKNVPLSFLKKKRIVWKISSRPIFQIHLKIREDEWKAFKGLPQNIFESFEKIFFGSSEAIQVFLELKAPNFNLALVICLVLN